MKKTIVINRQYASGGRVVAQLLSERLNIPFYDSKLVQLAAQEYGLSQGVLQDYDEKKIGSLLYSIAMVAGNNPTEHSLPYTIFRAQSETIRRLAGEGPCIIVGRCADYVLRGHCDFLSVFIYATSMEKRIQHAKTVDVFDEKDALSYIARREKERRDHYNFHTDKQWGRMSDYDMCLDSSVLGFEGCAKAILSVLED